MRIWLFAVLLVGACTGDRGPAGPMGPPGPMGEAGPSLNICRNVHKYGPARGLYGLILHYIS